MPGKKYPLKFKQEAIALAELKSVPKASVELGIKDNLLYRWRKELKPVVAEKIGKKSVLPQGDSELKRLRREVITLKEERDVLKKALAIFVSKEIKYHK